MAGLPPPPFPYCSPSDSPLDVYSPPQALQGGGRREGHQNSTPLFTPMPRFFLLPSHRSKRFHSKQQDSAPSPSLSTPHTHPLKPGYNRQTPQQRPFCSAAVGDAGSVLHQGGGPAPPGREKRRKPVRCPPEGAPHRPPPRLSPPRENRTPPWSERQTRPTPSGLQH